MSTADEVTFDSWWGRQGSRYEAAVIANGDTPWPLDPEKRAAIAELLGLPEDIDPMELRRAVWHRRYRRGSRQVDDQPTTERNNQPPINTEESKTP